MWISAANKLLGDFEDERAKLKRLLPEVTRGRAPREAAAPPCLAPVGGHRTPLSPLLLLQPLLMILLPLLPHLYLLLFPPCLSAMCYEPPSPSHPTPPFPPAPSAAATVERVVAFLLPRIIRRGTASRRRASTFSDELQPPTRLSGSGSARLISSFTSSPPPHQTQYLELLLLLSSASLS